jgi:hypothetical protein
MALLQKRVFHYYRRPIYRATPPVCPVFGLAGLIQVKAVMLEFVHSLNIAGAAQMPQMNI